MMSTVLLGASRYPPEASVFVQKGQLDVVPLKRRGDADNSLPVALADPWLPTGHQRNTRSALGPAVEQPIGH